MSLGNARSVQLGRGGSLGFRRGPDTWSARFRTRDGKQTHKFLGGPLEFDEAKRQAETWLAQLAGSAVRSVKRSTVREALEAHLADLRRHGRPDTAREAEVLGRQRTLSGTLWNATPRIATTACSDVPTACVSYPDSQLSAGHVAEVKTLSHVANSVGSVTPYR
jgi:hypothetical protein